MSISTETIIQKLEEKLRLAKKALHNHDEQMLTEQMITIKAYCELVLEAKTTNLPTPKQVQPQEKVHVLEETNKESLLDF